MAKVKSDHNISGWSFIGAVFLGAILALAMGWPRPQLRADLVFKHDGVINTQPCFDVQCNVRVIEIGANKRRKPTPKPTPRPRLEGMAIV